MTAPDALVDHLLSLETALQDGAVRHSETRLREILSPDFREFGRSGRAYGFDDIIASLVAETAADPTEITKFAVSLIAETVALATYLGIRITQNGDRLSTNRSSLWRLDADGQWRMIFHQGTATA